MVITASKTKAISSIYGLSERNKVIVGNLVFRNKYFNGPWTKYNPLPVLADKAPCMH